MTEDELRTELGTTSYDALYGADAERIRERDVALMRDLMRKRWKRGEFTRIEIEGRERWRDRGGR